MRTAARRSTRRHRASRGSRVIVRSDGTMSLEQRRQEREEAKLLVLGKRGSSLAVEWGPRQSGKPVNPPPLLVYLLGEVCVRAGLLVKGGSVQCSPDLTLAIEWER
ncbi:hypothetical protein NDU88_006921 [Pleurodeles waltl]|uniref:Uncharacterized protein n=1 Tax=Pleurodeles waltl TaxID=8319 RepID=A0AAV7U0T6_PLEWA|nr:hypothetical protein NDU88_006921 [Pleurodeles waltl]